MSYNSTKSSSETTIQKKCERPPVLRFYKLENKTTSEAAIYFILCQISKNVKYLDLLKLFI